MSNITREQYDIVVLIRDDGLFISEIISDYEAEHPEEFRKPRVYDYRDVDLPEVKALIGKEVYASDLLSFVIKKRTKPYTLHAFSGYENTPYETSGGQYQFIRAIDEPPKIKLTQAELIAIAAESRGVKPEQIVVEE